MSQFPGEKQRRGKKKRKDPNAPKRSLSAFFWFCNDERSKVKGLNPEYGIGDVAKELGRLWAECTPETKQKYQAMSEKDKARYEREMHLYKNGGSGQGANGSWNQAAPQMQMQQMMAPAQNGHGQMDDDEEEESDEEY